MKVLGIIAEYNPFHNGHAYHLELSKKASGADVAVAVMSGNFVQRGEPALINKWTRANTAVHNGIDLVLELPFLYACNDAGVFAKGAIGLLDSLGCIDYLSFGSETGQIEPLDEIVNVIEPETIEFTSILREKSNEGKPFAAAREETIAHFIGEEKAKLVNSPNNILGIEYLKQLKIRKSNIKPVTIKRHGSSLNDINKEISIAGATALRNMIIIGDIEGTREYMPYTSYSDLISEEENIANMEMFKNLIIYSIISKRNEDLAEIYSVTEGLENRIKEAVITSISTSELVEKIRSKRYPETRVNRVLMHVLNDLRRDIMLKVMKENQMYARVLAFTENGAALIKNIKKGKTSTTPVVTNIVKEADMFKDAIDVFRQDIIASDIYNLVTVGNINTRSEYRRIPSFVK